MRSKKFLALFSALSICLCMFAITPRVKAETGSLWEKLNEGGYRIDDGIVPPDGYEYIRVDSSANSHLVTKAKYDVRETTVVLSDLSISTGKFIDLMFSPSKSGIWDTPSNGIYNMRLYNNGSAIEYHVDFTHEGNRYDFGPISLQESTIPYADKYEISFINIGNTWSVRINNHYSAAWTKEIYSYPYESDVKDYERYITVGTNDNAKANIAIVKNDTVRNRWVANNDKLYNENKSEVTTNEATSLYLKAGSSISSLGKYNMLDNRVIFSNAAHSTSQWIAVTFSKSRTGAFPSNTQDQVALIIQPQAANLYVGANMFKLYLGHIALANKYEIGFVEIDGKYNFHINGNNFTADWISEFCSSGIAEDCYINVFTAYEGDFTADIQVVKNSDRSNDWFPTTGTYHQNVAGETDDVRRVTSSDSIATVSKHDLLHGNMTLKSAALSSEAKEDGSYYINTISFGRYGSKEAVSKSGELLCTTLTPNSVSNGIIETVDIYLCNTDGSKVKLGTVPAAKGYTYRFSKENGSYYLYVNGTKMAENALITELANAGTLEKCIVSLMTEKEFTTIPVFTESTWEEINTAGNSVNWTVDGADEAVGVTLAENACIRQKNKLDIRNAAVVIEKLVCGEVDSLEADVATNPLAVLTFAKSNVISDAEPVINQGLSIGLRSVYLEDTDEELMQVFSIDENGAYKALGTTELSRSYKISFVYSISSNKYALKINESLLEISDNEKAINFLESADKNVYVLISAQNTEISMDKVTVLNEQILGDVNGDGERDIVDMVLIARGMAEDNPEADADNDGAIGAEDVETIRKTWFAGGFKFIQ